MRETFEQSQARNVKQNAAGAACASASIARGERLTDAERSALTHWSRWGSSGYPVQKIGRHGWTIDHPAFKSCRMYATKTEAVGVWETLIAKWIRMKAHEDHPPEPFLGLTLEQLETRARLNRVRGIAVSPELAARILALQGAVLAERV